jgi:hypothetical protein
MRTLWIDSAGVAWEVVTTTTVDPEVPTRYVEDMKKLHEFLAQALGEAE